MARLLTAMLALVSFAAAGLAPSSIMPVAHAQAVTSVTVGSAPFGVGVNGVTNKIYIANFGPSGSGNTVSVIDGSTNTVVRTIVVGSGPRRAAVNDETNTIYVSNSGSNTVSVIDGSSDTVVATVNVGKSPRRAAVNRKTKKVYVANSGSNTVTVIDASTNTVTGKPIPVGIDPRGIGANEVTNKIYVANFGQGSGTMVSVIDGNTDTVVKTIDVGLNALDVAVNDATNKIYIANLGPVQAMQGQGTTVSVIDGSLDAVAGPPIGVGKAPADSAVDRVANRVYVANSGDNTVSVIDGSTGTALPTPIGVGSSPRGLGLNEATGIVYVANSGQTSPPTSSNTVSVIEFAPDTAASITSPADGSTLFTDFSLSLSATPGSGKIAESGTIIPRTLLSPQGSLTTSVEVAYSNTGSAADGTLTLTDNGSVVATPLVLANFRGFASQTFGVTLGFGAHALAVELHLGNSAGSSTATAAIGLDVNDTISSLTSLSFTVSGTATATYFGKLTFQVTTDGAVSAQGVLSDSAPSFASVALPTSVSGDQSLLLQEPIRVRGDSAGTITVTVSVAANGSSHSSLVTFAAER
jgi:YVTN family beta-propeller protein